MKGVMLHLDCHLVYYYMATGLDRTLHNDYPATKLNFVY